MFHTARVYEAHLPICNGVGSFKCPLCKKEFTNARKAVNQYHYCATKYKCFRCDAKFPSTQLLEDHCIKKRPERRCKICGALFYDNSQVQKHMEKIHCDKK